MDNPILENIVALISSGIIGFVLVVLGSAFEMAIMGTFGGLLIAVTLLTVIIGVILEVK